MGVYIIKIDQDYCFQDIIYHNLRFQKMNPLGLITMVNKQKCGWRAILG